MSAVNFVRTELASALARGVRQCVIIGSRLPFGEVLQSSSEQELRVFTLESGPEALAETLAKSDFDKLKASLFVWLGGAGCRTMEAALASLTFIASLPKGSGVLLDYAVEWESASSLPEKALDALASRISLTGGGIKHLIQPSAVAAMLRGLGFQSMVDVGISDGHLVSAVV